jgi:hypothetical protein
LVPEEPIEPEVKEQPEASSETVACTPPIKEELAKLTVSILPLIHTMENNLR